MSDQQTWVEALNISPESLSEWSSQVPTGKPLLVHCLEHGHVDCDAYLAWARENFGLAVLDPNFFQAEFDPSALALAKQNSSWSPWFFPVAQWEGFTYVACCEPPTEHEVHTRYLLCDPRAMNAAWGSPSAGAPAVEMPVGMTAGTAIFKLELDDSLFATPAEVAHAEAVQVAEPVTIAQVPQESVVVPMPTRAVAVEAPSSDEASAIENLFSSLRERYRSALIMKCSEQNARLYRWDESLKPSEDAAKTTVNLSFPTFLRIVVKTNLPYHGYLVDSPAHREFFQALGLENLPICVTVTPIRFETTLWGLVIAIGSEVNQKMDSLSTVQDATDRLVNTMTGVWSKAA